jgi:hypothetical protein
MTKDKQLALIYRHTHRDYRGTINGEKSIMTLRNGGSTIVPLSALTDDEIAGALPYALRKEAERKSGNNL